MQANKKTLLFLIPPTLMFLLSSCAEPQKPVEVVPLPDFDLPRQSGSIAKRFQESTPQGPTVVESAIELSEKYAKLSEQTAVLKQENQVLVAENRRLKNQGAALDAKLLQTKKELTEANDLLREMLIELNNWKNSVIGFREEMRGAEKAQLETLLKILKVLGGEAKAESDEGKATASPAVSASEPAQPQLQKTLINR